MPAIPTSEPDIITAGNSASWTKALPDFLPSDGWILNYAAQGPSQINFVSPTTSGAVFAIDLIASDTAGWMPGAYSLTGYVANAATHQRVTISQGSLSILPDPASQPPSTHAEYTLYLVELAIEGRIPRGLEQTSIDGQLITRITIPQLLDLRLKYQAEVRAERDRARVASGLPSRRTMYARFTSPFARFPWQQR